MRLRESTRRYFTIIHGEIPLSNAELPLLWLLTFMCFQQNVIVRLAKPGSLAESS